MKAIRCSTYFFYKTACQIHRHTSQAIFASVSARIKNADKNIIRQEIEINRCNRNDEHTARGGDGIAQRCIDDNAIVRYSTEPPLIALTGR